ncbi:IDEAL domain-containing protein [Caldibacillus thermolactis]|uniref:IDEAL domain-containing protein n=1 Tax=Pallidibacillus thermolactis TaxID=251051 RepID=A0ABT2WHD0_9BACI|nr:IDEAL domain-containing protein [Pallidibacillus thermolactis]MCU9594950.1 IDEAL domain-containing protein [Pallidibacillus thermolactis]MED1674060.1 IDEAL domain-containing protein [Pallidibacillus thermolactis subsp. kokeshiiformis]
MKKDNSYAELTKAYARANKREKFVQSIYIDLLIQEALLKEKRNQIKRDIDQAIDQHDKKSFMKLSQKLIEIEQQLNA